MKTTFKQAVDRFLRDRKTAGYKDNTIMAHRTALNKCLRAVGPEMDVKKLDRPHVTAMIEHCVALGNAENTINSVIGTLHVFFRWCRDEKLMAVDSNPMAGRRFRRVVPRQHDRINLSEFPALLDAAESQHPRDRMYLAMGLFTLLRQGEILSLKIKDIDLELNVIDAVLHKTYDRDQMRIVPELRKELRTWFTYYATQSGPLQGNWYLIPARGVSGFSGNPRTGGTRRPDRLIPTRAPMDMHDQVKAALASLGWEAKGKHLGSHTLRRSAARALYEELVKEGVDDALRQVSAWLHHRSVTTTELYLGITGDRERRNRRYEDAPMYPSLQADNVVALRSANGQAHAAGM